MISFPRTSGCGAAEAAIPELPTGYRLTFLLRDMEGLSNSEAAETLHLKVVAVKARVHRARLFLRRRLTEYLAEAHRAIPEKTL
jgi:RNA polymerase sigma-70 factor, ECF subfamily